MDIVLYIPTVRLPLKEFSISFCSNGTSTASRKLNLCSIRSMDVASLFPTVQLPLQGKLNHTHSMDKGIPSHDTYIDHGNHHAHSMNTIILSHDLTIAYKNICRTTDRFCTHNVQFFSYSLSPCIH